MELRKKSQVTIPKDVVEKLGLSEGDKLEVAEKDGVIYLLPVSVYPKKYVQRLEEIVKETSEDIKNGTIPVFDSPEKMFDFLDNN
jgi:AbrB family looped-hinge helix DNA binding protein